MNIFERIERKRLESQLSKTFGEKVKIDNPDFYAVKALKKLGTHKELALNDFFELANQRRYSFIDNQVISEFCLEKFLNKQPMDKVPSGITALLGENLTDTLKRGQTPTAKQLYRNFDKISYLNSVKSEFLRPILRNTPLDFNSEMFSTQAYNTKQRLEMMIKVEEKTPVNFNEIRYAKEIFARQSTNVRQSLSSQTNEMSPSLQDFFENATFNSQVQNLANSLSLDKNQFTRFLMSTKDVRDLTSLKVPAVDMFETPVNRRYQVLYSNPHNREIAEKNIQSEAEFLKNNGIRSNPELMRAHASYSGKPFNISDKVTYTDVLPLLGDITFTDNRVGLCVNENMEVNPSIRELFNHCTNDEIKAILQDENRIKAVIARDPERIDKHFLESWRPQTEFVEQDYQAITQTYSDIDYTGINTNAKHIAEEMANNNISNEDFAALHTTWENHSMYKTESNLPFIEGEFQGVKFETVRLWDPYQMTAGDSFDSKPISTSEKIDLMRSNNKRLIVMADKNDKILGHAIAEIDDKGKVSVKIVDREANETAKLMESALAKEITQKIKELDTKTFADPPSKLTGILKEYEKKRAANLNQRAFANDNIPGGGENFLQHIFSTQISIGRDWALVSREQGAYRNYSEYTELQIAARANEDSKNNIGSNELKTAVEKAINSSDKTVRVNCHGTSYYMFAKMASEGKFLVAGDTGGLVRHHGEGMFATCTTHRETSVLTDGQLNTNFSNEVHYYSYEDRLASKTDERWQRSMEIIPLEQASQTPEFSRLDEQKKIYSDVVKRMDTLREQEKGMSMNQEGIVPPETAFAKFKETLHARESIQRNSFSQSVLKPTPNQFAR